MYKKNPKLPKLTKELFVIRNTKGGFSEDCPCIIINGFDQDTLSLRKQKLILELLVADL